jgi:hypothetical protein
MSMLILSAFLIGALLGLRFKVLSVIPAIGLISIAACGAGVAWDNGVPAILMAATLSAACLQIGYVCGATVRYALPPGRRQCRALDPRRLYSLDQAGPLQNGLRDSPEYQAASTQYRG